VSISWNDEYAEITIAKGCGVPVKVKAPDGWNFTGGNNETFISGEVALRMKKS
jgi:hypothetical protein